MPATASGHRDAWRAAQPPSARASWRSCASCWARRLLRRGRGPDDRIEVEALVPARVAAMEEFQARGGALGELRVFRNLLSGVRCPRGGGGPRCARHVLSDISLHVLFL